MVIGGCAGSTTCGIKIFRLQILYQTAKAQIVKLLQPHSVIIPKYNKKSKIRHFYIKDILYIKTPDIPPFKGG